MPLFEVDPEKCNHDGICVDECPIKIIALKDKASVPQPVNGADQLCINCGHCVAVCPTGALSHQNMGPEDCPPVRKEWQLGPDQVEHFLRARRSIRTYKDKPVVRETLSRLIDIASHAPSGHNMQPVQWHVVHDTSVLQEQIAAVIDWMRYMIKEQPEMAGMMHLDMVVAAWEMGMDVICRGALKRSRAADAGIVNQSFYLNGLTFHPGVKLPGRLRLRKVGFVGQHADLVAQVQLPREGAKLLAGQRQQNQVFAAPGAFDGQSTPQSLAGSSDNGKTSYFLHDGFDLKLKIAPEKFC